MLADIQFILCIDFYITSTTLGQYIIQMIKMYHNLLHGQDDANFGK